MKLDHGCFGFSKESLKVENIFSFFGSFVLRDLILLLPTSHLGNSVEFTELYRVSTDSMSVSYLMLVSMRFGPSRLRIGRIVPDSIDYLNPNPGCWVYSVQLDPFAESDNSPKYTRKQY